MQMRDYLRAVLPAEGNGFYCASELLDIIGDNGKRLFRNRFFSALDLSLRYLSPRPIEAVRLTYTWLQTRSKVTRRRKSDNAHSSRAFFLTSTWGRRNPRDAERCSAVNQGFLRCLRVLIPVYHFFR